MGLAGHYPAHMAPHHHRAADNGHGISEKVMKSILKSSFSVSNPPTLGRTARPLPLDAYIHRHVNRFGRGMNSLFYFGVCVHVCSHARVGVGVRLNVNTCVGSKARIRRIPRPRIPNRPPKCLLILLGFCPAGTHVDIDSRQPGSSVVSERRAASTYLPLPPGQF